MTELNLDVLGLGVNSEAAAPVVAAVAAESAGETARAPRTEIKITGALKRERVAVIPEVKRGSGFGGGQRGSKYPFDDLEAPDATGFDSFEVRLTDVENADAKKLKGAIQAAVAAQNKSAADEGKVNKYVSRAITENGEYVGSLVLRVDAYEAEGDEEEVAETAAE